jgi:hypothetical protein
MLDSDREIQEVAQRTGTLHFFVLMLWQTDERIANRPVLAPLSEGACLKKAKKDLNLSWIVCFGWFLEDSSLPAPCCERASEIGWRCSTCCRWGPPTHKAWTFVGQHQRSTGLGRITRVTLLVLLLMGIEMVEQRLFMAKRLAIVQEKAPTAGSVH